MVWGESGWCGESHIDSGAGQEWAGSGQGVARFRVGQVNSGLVTCCRIRKQDVATLKSGNPDGRGSGNCLPCETPFPISCHCHCAGGRRISEKSVQYPW